jgi:hypothetical protein
MSLRLALGIGCTTLALTAALGGSRAQSPSQTVPRACPDAGRLEIHPGSPVARAGRGALSDTPDHSCQGRELTAGHAILETVIGAMLTAREGLQVEFMRLPGSGLDPVIKLPARNTRPLRSFVFGQDFKTHGANVPME